MKQLNLKLRLLGKRENEFEKVFHRRSSSLLIEFMCDERIKWVRKQHFMIYQNT